MYFLTAETEAIEVKLQEVATLRASREQLEKRTGKKQLSLEGLCHNFPETCTVYRPNFCLFRIKIF